MKASDTTTPVNETAKREPAEVPGANVPRGIWTGLRCLSWEEADRIARQHEERQEQSSQD